MTSQPIRRNHWGAARRAVHGHAQAAPAKFQGNSLDGCRAGLQSLILDYRGRRYRPLLLHCKGAGQEVLEELQAQRPVRGVFHGFAGNRAEAEAWIELGFYVGIGVRAVRRNLSADLEDAIRSMPLGAMLLETDSTVRSYTGEEGLQLAAVTEVAETVARIRGCTPEEVGRQTTANLRAMLRQ